MNIRQKPSLPDERENAEAITREYAEDFCFAAKLLDAAAEVLHQLAKTDRFDDSPIVKAAVGGILTRELRRYRAIMHIAEFGLIENVDVLTRVLFEGALATRFILNDFVPAENRSNELNKRLCQQPAIPVGFSRTEFRSWLYSYMPTIKFASMVDQLGMDSASRQEILDSVAEAEKAIGPQWIKVLTKFPKTYSGLCVRDLSESGGLLSMYHKLYSLQSMDIHASDGLASLEHENLEGKNSVSFMIGTARQRVEQIPTHMRLASGVLLILLYDIGKAFELDLIALKRIHDAYFNFISET